MRRPALALALLLGSLGAAAQSASTAGNTVPSSTAVYRATTVTGAVAVNMRYTVMSSSVTTVTARLQKTGLLTTTVTAAFGSDAPVTCVAGLITVLNTLTGLGEADFTCTGFLERADRPRKLTITAR